MFESNEIRALLDGKTVAGEGGPVLVKPGVMLRAMILLGVNAGFGNGDCAALPLSAVNLETGWVQFPRPKTGIERRCALWPETVAALRTAIEARPKPKDCATADCCS
jgi:integrase